MQSDRASEPMWVAIEDPIGEALHSLRMSGTFYCRSEFTAPWGVDLPAMEGYLMFHVVTAGRCWVEVKGMDPCLLQCGDMALLPRGQGHRLTFEPDAEVASLFDLPRELISERYELLKHGGGGDKTTMICGAVHFEHPAAHRVIKMLPKLIRVEASSQENDWIQSTMRYMISEASSMRAGGETIITRVSDILVIQAIRNWIERSPEAKKGWLGALQDKQIGKVIAQVHRDPVYPWTVASLASVIGMSRSAFAARFLALVGEPPMQYVRRWRMHVAVDWLKENTAPLGELAERLGYQSEAAFSRAFKKFMGFTPGSVRRQAS